jgi:hypothetical protein
MKETTMQNKMRVAMKLEPTPLSAMFPQPLCIAAAQGNKATGRAVAPSFSGAAPAAGKKLAASRKTHALLALDGSRLSPKILTAAAKRSVDLAERLDILLVNPPKAPTSLLWSLLVYLEHAGVYYRLASTEGDLGNQVLTYLNRFVGINLVLVEGLAPLEQGLGVEMAQLRSRGYQILPIIEAG